MMTTTSLAAVLVLICSLVKVQWAGKESDLKSDTMPHENGRFLLSKDEMKKSAAILLKGGKHTYFVEVYVMLDYSIYQWWTKLYKGNSRTAEQKLKTFYAYVFKKVKTRYNKVDLNGNKIDIGVVDIKIAKSKDEVPFVESKYKISDNMTDSYTVLLNLTNHLKTARRDLPRYDVFAFFTKYDIGVFNGLAWPYAVCTDHGVSVSKETGFYDTRDTATHEIGHNLGSNHDNGTDCEYDDMFIMAAAREDFTNDNFDRRNVFSPCSLEDFNKNLLQMAKESSNCLVIKSNQNYFDLDALTREPFAKAFDADMQCRILFGPDSFFCGNHLYKDVCRSLTCWDPSINACTRSIRGAAGDGTPCGSGKACKDEVCQVDRSTPSGKEDCYYGDWKGTFDDDRGKKASCKDVADKTYLCYMEDVAKLCCVTCAKAYRNKKDCNYGDHVSGCTRNKCTYSNAHICCRTCEVDPSDACPFGDKASWCKDLKAFSCYNDEAICCSTCKKFLNNKVDKDCRYGDMGEFCEEKVKKLPLVCKNKKYQTECCHSCKSIDLTACIDLDPDYCAFISAGTCYEEVAKENCCKKCKSFEKKDAKKDCKYGDLSVGCTIKHCSNNKASCCHTCRGK